MDATLAPPLVIPPRNGCPLLLSIPHSGREYPAWLVAEARHGRRALATLEDPLVDRLAWRAIAAGYGAVIAQAPRGAIDCNRSPDELDPAAIADIATAPVGPRARHGLGIVPSRTHHHGALWKRLLPRARFETRLATVHTAYHTAVGEGVAALRREHRTVVLLDLHSMPPRAPGTAQIIVGDRHGVSCAPDLADTAMAIATRAELHATRNDPYAGGYIVERHGRPASGIHALQIEIDRSLYLARDLMSPGHGFDRISRLVETLANGLVDRIGLMEPSEAIAAE